MLATGARRDCTVSRMFSFRFILLGLPKVAAHRGLAAEQLDILTVVAVKAGVLETFRPKQSALAVDAAWETLK